MIEKNKNAKSTNNAIKENRPLIVFIIKALSLYLFFISVNALQKTTGILDTPLRHLEAISCDFLLEISGFNVSWKDSVYSSTYLMIDGKKLLGIANSCNGLVLLEIFMGFIIICPGKLKNKAWYIPAGLLTILIVNIIRIYSLALIQMFAPEYLEFNHHYVFSTLVYGIIFLFWMIYINKVEGHSKLLLSINKKDS